MNGPVSHFDLHEHLSLCQWSMGDALQTNMKKKQTIISSAKNANENQIA